jgi:branched-chain amino acid transport system permease protein
MAQFLGAFTPHDFYFDLAFTLLAMLIVGGMGSSLGALAGTALTTVLIEVARRFEGGGEVLGLAVPPVFGLPQAMLAIGMLWVIWRRPHGLTGGNELNMLARFGRAARVSSAARPEVHEHRETLTIESVTCRFGGLMALDSVACKLEPGVITGIIGPNGAGKTTLINVMSGHVRATTGAARLGRASLERGSPHRAARAGVARTFQNIRIFQRMSVLENVLVAALQVQPNLAAAERAAMRELERVGLADKAADIAGSLAYGLRRRLEIARALALEPHFLLLDEPAAGMNGAETAELVRMLEEVRRERHIGIVLVEHDMQMVMRLCARIVVLDHGKVIAMGTPDEIRGDPAVIEAYLGKPEKRAVAAHAPDPNFQQSSSHA